VQNLPTQQDRFALVRERDRVTRIDLNGKRFGRWTVISYAGDRRWFCVCDCGTRADVIGQSLRSGHSRSCGCLKGEMTNKRNVARRIDLSGRRFGRWVVRTSGGNRTWDCVCDCGTRRVVRGNHLSSGASKSCGCLCRDICTKHGMCGTKEYEAWKNAKQRCLNPNHPSFPDYGGRGIGFYADWIPDYLAFFADSGECPAGCSLDRPDNDRGYMPDNVRWVSAQQQAWNRRPRRKRGGEAQSARARAARPAR
jgi:hypothetical protein